MIFLDTCLLIDYSKEKIDIDLSKNYCINSIVRLEFKVGDLLVEKYSLSHGMGIYDTIIAATCLVYDLPLWTYNQKDFRFIDELELKDAK
ncbi:MAG: hypothetical protein U9O56_03890 [Campylobacterota bacterium]|nr:hypothetical protein [Campylobacterota bacterium]